MARFVPDPGYELDDVTEPVSIPIRVQPPPHVIRRNGSRVPCDMGKIRRRVEILCNPDLKRVDVEALLLSRDGFGVMDRARLRERDDWNLGRGLRRDG